ncbi:hypothetical protein [Pseudoxanthomonas sacheonensis]|uniref:Uncharacterized protein n=1 Tax=Pseudoxanthomonas sacheonensis TaxID=443615 RepID=A0ABU1RQG9_9GAMM|nr:hypothetical protein [Pseudoxanthomonas sacheonensis]MDR6841021.1 hypothetical protein [Pseudoxanthomonas sacheonensis]
MTNPELRKAVDKLASLTFADIPPGLAEGPTPLETLLNLLPGGGACVLADPGIAAYDPQTLDRISTTAELESDHCLDRAHCLLELLHATLATDPPALPQATAIGALRHLTRFLTDHQRWHVLADNAAYYRDHPEIANQIAAHQHPA